MSPRKQMAEDVYDSYHRMRRPASEQGKVWNEMSRKLGKMGSRSGSDALEQAYEDRQAEMGNIIRDFRCSTGDNADILFRTLRVAFGGLRSLPSLHPPCITECYWF